MSLRAKRSNLSSDRDYSFDFEQSLTRKSQPATTLFFSAACRLLLIIASLIFPADASAYNPSQDDYLRLSATPLGAGSAVVARPGEPTAIFHNPASLAGITRFSLSHNHSGRHFPGSTKEREMDQLDGDTQAIVVPLGPLASFGYGFNFQGEGGYDYINHPPDEFPREKYEFIERIEGWGAFITPITRIGASHRSNFRKLRNDEEPVSHSNWVSFGEGESIGLLQTVFPGVIYGYAREKLDYDWTDGRAGRMKKTRRGFSFKPLGWIRLLREREDVLFDMPTPYGNTDVIRYSTGAEIIIGPSVLRIGSFGGKRTLGISFNLLGITLSYAEIKDKLNDLIGATASRFQDIHIYSLERK